MYLKFVRNIQPCGEVRRGTIYSVHFQPNEMGDYNEELTIISDAYEIPRNESFPLPLTYQADVVRINGYLRLTFGDPNRKSALHLIDPHAREEFVPHLRVLLNQRTDVRIEVADCK